MAKKGCLCFRMVFVTMLHGTWDDLYWLVTCDLWFVSPKSWWVAASMKLLQKLLQLAKWCLSDLSHQSGSRMLKDAQGIVWVGFPTWQSTFFRMSWYPWSTWQPGSPFASNALATPSKQDLHPVPDPNRLSAFSALSSLLPLPPVCWFGQWQLRICPYCRLHHASQLISQTRQLGGLQGLTKASANFPTKMASLNIWLVVDLPLWKMMEFVNGKDDIPYMKWKIQKTFETTNQICIYIYIHTLYMYSNPNIDSMVPVTTNQIRNLGDHQGEVNESCAHDSPH